MPRPPASSCRPDPIPPRGRAARGWANARRAQAEATPAELGPGHDPPRGGGGRGWDRLYGFLHGELVRANVEKDAVRVASCRLLVEPLRQAWHEAADAL